MDRATTNRRRIEAVNKPINRELKRVYKVVNKILNHRRCHQLKGRDKKNYLRVGRIVSALKAKLIKYPGNTMHLYNRELEFVKELQKRTPEKWLSVLAEVKPEARRRRVACIVWWDYFGHRLVPKRWGHLDALIEMPYVHHSLHGIYNGLRRVGYTPWAALRRLSSSQKDIYDDESRNGSGTPQSEEGDQAHGEPERSAVQACGAAA